uniref:Calponin-homology (CH) domain-containing protein n=1 Tax=Elaeophora elaphi TaxID=1147741 RepID=A0A0R3RMF8_9BILA
MDEHSDSDELAFFLDMAMNESQRWLEVTCRELFIDKDDFIYSLRYGTHLRKIINKIIPDCFDLSRSHHGKTARTTRQILAKANISNIEFEQYIDNEDWISQFLLICLYRLHIPRHLLFLREDLEQFEGFEKPYKVFVKEQYVYFYFNI